MVEWIEVSDKVSLNSLKRSTRVSVIQMIRIFILQSWGDHTDVSQAVVVYIFATGSVCVYCWLGNELSEQVRKMMLSNQI
jgi:hypothetical protein